MRGGGGLRAEEQAVELAPHLLQENERDLQIEDRRRGGVRVA